MSEKNITIVSPANGTAVTLEQVPDAVFADKILVFGLQILLIQHQYLHRLYMEH